MCHLLGSKSEVLNSDSEDFAAVITMTSLLKHWLVTCENCHRIAG